MDITVIDGTRVSLRYRPEFEPLLTDDQKTSLRQNGIKIISTARSDGTAQEQWTAFDAKGQFVHLQNRSSLPNQYFLSKPLAINVRHVHSERRFDKGKAGNIGGVLLAPVLIPVTMCGVFWVAREWVLNVMFQAA